MHDVFRGVTGERLELDTYWRDFDEHFWKTGQPGFWKLERQQTFQEPNEASWLAFAHGDWTTSMDLIEGKRAAFKQYYQRISHQGFASRRVRVVEQPISPYLQWELHVLRLRHEFGGLTSVISAEQVASLESSGPLPEIYTLGTQLMYEAVYDDAGLLAAAHRFHDRGLIVACQRLIADLYQQGEPLDKFFAREIAALPPPRP